MEMIGQQARTLKLEVAPALAVVHQIQRCLGKSDQTNNDRRSQHAIKDCERRFD